MGLEFSLGDGFFYGIPHKPIIPFIAKGLFGSHHRLYGKLERVITGLTKIPVRDMKIIPPRHRLLDGMFTDITGNSFHDYSFEIGLLLFII
jgi:hypothetical protein